MFTTSLHQKGKSQSKTIEIGLKKYQGSIMYKEHGDRQTAIARQCYSAINPVTRQRGVIENACQEGQETLSHSTVGSENRKVSDKENSQTALILQKQHIICHRRVSVDQIINIVPNSSVEKSLAS